MTHLTEERRWLLLVSSQALAFRPIDLIRVDMIAVLGLVAIIAQVRNSFSTLCCCWPT
jgi:hypothetical protein